MCVTTGIPPVQRLRLIRSFVTGRESHLAMADNLRLAAEPAVTTIPVVTVPARVTEVPTSVPVTQVAPVTQVTQSQVSGVAATLSQPGYIIQGPPGPPSSHVASPRVYYRGRVP